MKCRCLIGLLVVVMLLLGGAVGCTWQASVGSTGETPTATPEASPTAESAETGKTPERQEKETIRRGKGWLGVVLEDAEEGVRVTAVVPESPADKGGVKEGDVITRVGGNRVRTSSDVSLAMADMGIGEQVLLTLRRNGEDIEIKITVGERSGTDLNPLPGESSALEDWLSTLPMLRGVESEDIFKHFAKGQLTVIDKEGQEIVLSVVAGQIESIDGDSITIKPNGQGVYSGPYSIVETTTIQSGRDGGSIDDLLVGDDVLIVTREGDSEAMMVTRVDHAGWSLRIPSPSSIPGWDDLRERLGELGLPDLPDALIPDPGQDYGFKLN